MHARSVCAQLVSTLPSLLRVCSYAWLDVDTLVAAVVPPGVGPPPDRPLAPVGPRIEDNTSGKKSPSRTYQDLLQSPTDEALFEHYGTSALVTIKASARG